MKPIKYTYIGPNKIDEEGREWPTKIYGGLEALNGEVVELSEPFATKAKVNPCFEQVKPGPKAKPKEVREELFGVSAKDRQKELSIND